MNIDKRIGDALADQSAVAAINRALRLVRGGLLMGINVLDEVTNFCRDI